MNSLEDVLDEWKGTSCFVIVIEIIKTFSITRFPFVVAILDNPPNQLHPLTFLLVCTIDFLKRVKTMRKMVLICLWFFLYFLLQNNILEI